MPFRNLIPATALVGLVGMAACAPGAGPATLQPSGATSAAITASDLEHRVHIIAHDSMRGREPGTRGDQLTARYLASEAERLGLRPVGADGTFFQPVPLVRRTTSARVDVAGAEGGERALGTDVLLPVSGIGGLPRTSRASGSGPLLFGGHLYDPQVGADELDLGQLQGAAVMVRLAPPPGVTSDGAAPRMPIAMLFSPASPAAAVILIVDEQTEDFWEYAAELPLKGSIELRADETERAAGPQFFLMAAEEAERILGEGLATARQPRLGLGSFRYDLTEDVRPVESANVVAVLPGRDPRLAGQLVTLGAHMDHVGVGTPVDGDSIYNGADDNASGTMALLEIAERLASLPANRRPLRSVLFTWHAAEESGLLGSEYFTDNPTLPRDSMIAHINLDMVGRNHPDSLFVVGSRRIATEFGDIVEQVNQRQQRPFIFDYTFDEPGHPEMIYCRSDHWNFARYGIPITFLTTGLHEDYHKPSDTPDLLDYDKLARVSNLVFDIVEAVANRPNRLVVDQPVPPLGTPCH